jgi:hypothetical protein
MPAWRLMPVTPWSMAWNMGRTALPVTTRRMPAPRMKPNRIATSGRRREELRLDT